jgi:hypothetical protein
VRLRWGYGVVSGRSGTLFPDYSETSEGCVREAGLNVGASPTRLVGLFAAEHDLNSATVRRGWKLRKMNRRAVTKVNHR